MFVVNCYCDYFYTYSFIDDLQFFGLATILHYHCRYVETITDLFEISGDFVTQDVSQNLMTLIAEGSGDDDEGSEEADLILRQHSVTIYANLLSKSVAKLPRLLVETMAWVLGEYAYLSEEYTLEEIVSELCGIVRMGKQLTPSTRKIIISAIMKLVAQAGQCPPDAAKVIDDFTKSKDVDLQQRCLEFQNLITTVPHLLGEVLPVDASCEDLQVDPNLSFLDAFVNQAIADGAKEYEKPEDDDDEYEIQYTSKKVSAFKMTPYEKPTKPGASFNVGSMGGLGSGSSAAPSSSMSGVTPPPGAYGNNAQGSSISNNTNSGEPQLNVRNVANVWGKGGLTSGGGIAPTSTSSATPTPAPVPSTSTNTWSNSSTYSSSTSTYTKSAPPPEPVKSEELIRKEKMAAALFGGGGQSAPSPARVARRTTAPRSTAATASRTTAVSSAPALPPTTAPVTASAQGPPASTPEFDLLDFMSDPSPVHATPLDSGIDILSPSPMLEPEPQPEPTPAPVEVDPFAASGLLDGFSDTPLNPLVSNDKFQHNGQTLAPLQITTPQFGAKWGSTPHSSPLFATSSKYSTLDEFMGLCKTIGAHAIEAIPATNEGICAGMLGGANIVLIHGKISNGGRVDVTIKSTDATIGGCLAMYMQNMMR